jgi:peptidase E
VNNLNPAPEIIPNDAADAAREPGVVSIGNHFTDGTVHLISNYWGLGTFLDAAGITQVDTLERPMELAFISTASRPYPEFGQPSPRFLQAERAWLDQQQEAGRINWFEYCIVGRDSDQILEELADVDGILVGGGNTQYLQEQLVEGGRGQAIRDLVLTKKKWYLGKSAGAIVAGPDIDPRGLLLDSMASGPIEDTTGLGLTDVYPLPHIDTPSIMEKEHNGKTGWEIAAELTERFPTAYILDKRVDNSTQPTQ